jgi:hypothetical protein
VNRRNTWAAWQPQPEAGDPSQGGMDQLAAYDAGLTDDPGCWVQKLELRGDPRLDPRSPDYDPQYAAEVAWEEPSPEDIRVIADRQPDIRPQAGYEPEEQAEPELPF